MFSFSFVLNVTLAVVIVAVTVVIVVFMVLALLMKYYRNEQESWPLGRAYQNSSPPIISYISHCFVFL